MFHTQRGVQPTRTLTQDCIHAQVMLEPTPAEVPNNAESPSRTMKSVSTILQGRVSSDRNDDLRVSGRGGVDGLNEERLSPAWQPPAIRETNGGTKLWTITVYSNRR